MNDKNLMKRAADNIRILSVAMVEKAKSGHPGGAMGGADFINVLYSEFLEYDPKNPYWEGRDRFYLDPGHMSPMLYGTLALAGKYSLDDLKQFRQWGSVTPGHPEVDLAHGIENSSGPLGQGHAYAVGAAIAAKILRVTRIFVGVEENKPDAIEALKSLAGKYGAKIIPLRVRYPQGAEKQLIYAITGRQVVAGGLPMDVGCVVQNVGTCAAIRDAVVEGHPLIERATTVTGSPVKDPCTWLLRIGTPVAEALKLAGGLVKPAAKLILGGPMMGFSQATTEVTVTKNTSGILLLQLSETGLYTSHPCIRCGRCVDACPMRLLPGPISVLVESEKYDMAEQAFVMDCLECGVCTYVCPAKRPLVQHFRRAKAEINALRRAAKK